MNFYYTGQYSISNIPCKYKHKETDTNGLKKNHTLNNMHSHTNINMHQRELQRIIDGKLKISKLTFTQWTVRTEQYEREMRIINQRIESRFKRKALGWVQEKVLSSSPNRKGKKIQSKYKKKEKNDSRWPKWRSIWFAIPYY